MPYSKLLGSLNFDASGLAWIEITEALPDTVFLADPTGSIVFVSRMLRDFTGMSTEELVGDGWLQSVHPEDRSRAAAAWGAAVLSKGRCDQTYRFIGRNREVCWFRCRADPTYDRDGEVVRWVGVVSDLHELKVADERREVIVDELRHRQKNLMAIVQAIADLTSRDEPDPLRFRNALAGRLGALARVSDTLASTDCSSLDLHRLILEETAPFQRLAAGQVFADGPAVQIPAGKVVAIALIIHELITNAVKYGALSVPDGRLSVTWIVENGLAHVSWIESGGPAASQNPGGNRDGFGTLLLKSIAPRELAGPVDHQVGPTGVRCGFSFDLD